MSRSTRREKMESELVALINLFDERLIVSLRACVGGRWGIFGCKDPIAGEKWVSHYADELLTLGEKIRDLQRKLGINEEHRPYIRLLHYRSLRGPNDSGEPKLARRFLEELGEG